MKKPNRFFDEAQCEEVGMSKPQDDSPSYPGHQSQSSASAPSQYPIPSNALVGPPSHSTPAQSGLPLTSAKPATMAQSPPSNVAATGRRPKPSKVNQLRQLIYQFFRPVIDDHGARFLVPFYPGPSLLAELEVVAPTIKSLAADHANLEVSDGKIQDALSIIFESQTAFLQVQNGRTWLDVQAGNRFVEVDGQILVFPLGQEALQTAQQYPPYWQPRNRRSYSMLSTSGPSSYFSPNSTKLGDYVGLPPDRDLLIYAFMVLSLMPDRQTLALELTSETGREASFLNCMIKALVDPVVKGQSLRTIPHRVSQLNDLAWQHHVLNFDQLDQPLPQVIQRRLADLVLGADLPWRSTSNAAYDVSSIRVRRACLFSGVEPVVTYPELVEKTLSLELPATDSFHQVSHHQQIDARAMAILTQGMMTLLGKAHAYMDRQTLPSMAPIPDGWEDFCRIGLVVSHALTGSYDAFWHQYRGYCKERSQEKLEQHPVAQAIQSYLDETFQEMIEKSVGEWHEVLAAYCPEWASSDWPPSPRAFGAALKQASPVLRAHGISCSSNGKRGSRCRWSIGYQGIASQHF